MLKLPFPSPPVQFGERLEVLALCDGLTMCGFRIEDRESWGKKVIEGDIREEIF
jgi:hypothetical protein